MAHKENITLGVIYSLLAAFCYAAMSFVGKIVSKEVTTNILVFARFVISLILILPWVLVKSKDVFVISQTMKVINRSFITFLAFGSFFYSLQFISLSNAILLNHTFPLFVPLFAWIYSKATTSYKVWLGILTGFVGIGLVLDLTSGGLLLPSLIALLSGILAAISILIVRNLTKTTPIVQILFYNVLVCSILSGILLPFNWVSMNKNTFILLGVVGIFGAFFQFFITSSFAKAPARIVAPLMFFSVLLGVLADFLFWHQVPTNQDFLGMLLVIIGAVVTVYFGAKTLTKKKN